MSHCVLCLIAGIAEIWAGGKIHGLDLSSEWKRAIMKVKEGGNDMHCGSIARYEGSRNSWIPIIS